MNKINSRKGQVFVIGIVIVVTLGLISSLIIMGYLYGDKTEDEHLGTYQSGMIDAIKEGDKMLLYVDNIGKFSVNDALIQFADNGAIAEPSIYDTENTETDYCGKYIYNLWNNEKETCWPKVENNFGPYIGKDINDKIKGKNLGYKEYIKYSVRFDVNTIYAIAEVPLSIYVFKNNDYKENPEIQNYIVQKEELNVINSVVLGDYKSLIRKLKFTAGTPSCTLLTDKLMLISPSTGILTSIFDPNRLHPVYKTIRPHKGVDIAAPSGTPVLAVADGKVTKAGVGQGYGNVVYIDHNGFETRYAHLSSFSVSAGQSVKKGEEIGKVGNTGVGTGPHLHFEIRKGMDAIDPLAYISCVQSPSTPRNAAPGTCQTAENKDWKITSLKTNAAEIDGSKNMEITMSIENKDNCITVTSIPKIEMQKNSNKVCGFTSKNTCYIEITAKESKNIYKSTSQKPYDDTLPFVCTFNTDANKVKQEQDKGNCVLLAPSDDNKITYVITGNAKDSLGRKPPFPTAKNVIVSKPAVSQTPSVQTTAANKVDPKVQEKFDSTMKKLKALNVYDYAVEQANINGIPPEVFLGIITQESGGNMHAGSIAGAYGLTQVMTDIHIDRIKKECGNKQNFMNDAKCQIRVGAGILKAVYNPKQTLYYKCNVNCLQGGKGYQPCASGASCGTKCIGPTDLKKYSEWSAAARKYNGGGSTKEPAQGAQTAGCTGYPDYEYVEKVMGYAAAAGYSGINQITSEQQVALEEIKAKGVIGTYSVYPSFSAKTPFDLNLINNLSEWMNYSVNVCRVSNDTRSVCLQKMIDEFNTNISQKYVDAGIFVNLTRDCTDDDELEEFHAFIESIEDCSASSDIECQCKINNTKKGVKVPMEGKENSATFTFTTNGNSYDVRSEHQFRDANNNAVAQKEINLKDFQVLKKFDHMKTGQYKNIFCQPVQNKFRMCLDTDYKIPYAFGNKILEKNVTLKFAVTIRDNVPPIPVKNIALTNRVHSERSIILSFEKNPEGDVSKYLVYLGDSEQDFSLETKELKKKLPYRTLDLGEGNMHFKDMDLTQEPECELTSGTDGQYCTFKYQVTATDGTSQKVVIEENKLYYIENTKKFFYIINGTDPYNKMNVANKFIAVTAVDVDLNEIDNVRPDQKIELNKNLKSIIPLDSLEQGFVKITSMVMKKVNNVNTITLAWEKPRIRLDGAKITSSETFNYKIYIIDSGCSEYALCDITNVAPNKIFTSTIEGTTPPIFMPSITGVNSYTIVVTALGQNGKEYSKGIARIVR